MDWLDRKRKRKEGERETRGKAGNQLGTVH